MVQDLRPKFPKNLNLFQVRNEHISSLYFKSREVFLSYCLMSFGCKMEKSLVLSIIPRECFLRLCRGEKGGGPLLTYGCPSDFPTGLLGHPRSRNVRRSTCIYCSLYSALSTCQGPSQVNGSLMSTHASLLFDLIFDALDWSQCLSHGWHSVLLCLTIVLSIISLSFHQTLKWASPPRCLCFLPSQLPVKSHRPP